MTEYYECPKCGEEIPCEVESHDEIIIDDQCDTCKHVFSEEEKSKIATQLSEDFVGGSLDWAADWVNDR